MRTAKALDKYDNRSKSVFIHDDEIWSREAEIAYTLIEKLGVALCWPDGEDSSGRAKWRPGTPEEIAARACDLAAAMVHQFRSRAWTFQGPSVDDILGTVKDKASQ